MNLEIKENVLLSPYTTLHIGGVADYLVEVLSEEELKAALRFAEANLTAPSLIIGGGSNILFSDEGYRGLVIVNKILGRHYEEVCETVLLTSGAGEILDDVIEEAVAKEFSGLENLSSIPGTVGATPVQNVGAYGVEVSSLIKKVSAINKKTFSKKVFTNSECDFSYRNSFFKTDEGKEWVITEVVFELQKKFAPVLAYGALTDLRSVENLTPAGVRETVQAIRSEKFPDWNVVGTAGSFFKNPIITNDHYMALKKDYPELVGYRVSDSETKVSLGWILDKVCDLRGYTSNNVRLYEKQALVLVADKGATADDVKKFVTQVSDKVFEKTKIKIEPEVLML